MSIQRQRENLEIIFDAGLRTVNGHDCVARYLSQHRPAGPVRVVAAGKAAPDMASAALEVLGEDTDCLVISKRQPQDAGVVISGHTTRMFAGHPWPDEGSLAAGSAMTDFVRQAPSDAGLLFLISGGASSLVEVLPEGIGLDDLRRVNQWLLGSGLDIRQMNAVRKSLSCIKAGRLATMLGHRQAQCLMISDVPGDDVAVIGSGLLTPDDNIQNELTRLTLPGWMETLLSYAPQAPHARHACFANIEIQVIANNALARNAAAAQAVSMGYAIQCNQGDVTGDVASVARQIVARLTDGACGAYLWGGETTLKLPPEPGKGGRNQQLAVDAARLLAGRDDIVLLVAATDGSDGPTTDAGGLVDGHTVDRGRGQGLDIEQCLAKANAGAFLRASGDLYATGATGTNVMDLIIGLKFSN